jgi:hypothetical protein
MPLLHLALRLAAMRPIPAMISSLLPHLRASLGVALLPLALAACGGALQTRTTDDGADANAAAPSDDAGFDASPDGTLLDGTVLDDASTSPDAGDSSAISQEASIDAASDASAYAASDANTDADAPTSDSSTSSESGLSDAAPTIDGSIWACTSGEPCQYSAVGLPWGCYDGGVCSWVCSCEEDDTSFCELGCP